MVLIIGLTGGIATGKSTVTKVLHSKYHIEVISADEVVKALQGPSTWCIHRIQRKWPQCIRTETISNKTQLTLDREVLGRIIFADQKARKELNRLMRLPILISIIKKTVFLCLKIRWSQFFRFISLRRGNILPPIIVLEIPLLFENKFWLYLVDAVVVVSCRDSVQISRLCMRNDLTIDEALQRISSQLPLSEKCRLADYIVFNDGDEEGLIEETNKLVEWLYRKNKKKYCCALLSASFLITSVLGIMWIYR